LGEIGRNRGFLIGPLGETAAFVGKAGAVARIGEVWQPQRDRTQSALPLCGAMPGDPIARGWAGFHGVTRNASKGHFQGMEALVEGGAI
jgi:hypothetical protein